MREAFRRMFKSRDDLRFHIITPVFVILIAGITGFIFANLNDGEASAGTTIKPETATAAQINSGTVAIDANAINITIEAWGGGGGGGGTANSLFAYGASGGGGSGGYIIKNFGKSKAASNVTGITVGGGGPGGNAGNNSGTAGGASEATWGGITIIANGGNPGGGASGSGEGSAGSGGAISNNGDTGSSAGNPGTAGCCSNGGSSKVSGQGGDAPNGGLGGASVGGRTGEFEANPGNSPGGGGGGSRGNWVTSLAGGNGGAGAVNVSWQVVSASIIVDDISPYNYGPHTGGNTVTINGDFSGVSITSIVFGGVTIPASDLIMTSSSITLTVPESTTTGWTNVTFNYKDSYGHFDWSTTENNFYEYRAVNINSIATNYGPHAGGNVVTITGSGFGNGTSDANAIKPRTICFGNDCTTNFTVVNDTTITVTVPSHVMVNSLSDWVSVTIYYNNPANQPSWSVSKTSLYEYRKGATTYKNECYSSDTGQWTSQPDYLYTAQGSTVNCRIILDGMYAGDIGLLEDYEETIGPGLGGIFASNDSRFGYRNFALTYANTYDPNNQTLLYSYEAPDSDVLEAFYDEDANDGEGNGDDLFWPLIDVSDSTGNLTQLGYDVVLGLLAEEYYILPIQPDDKHCVDCTSTFRISTHGAPYFGTVTLSDDISNIGHGGGQTGTFTVEGQVGNVVDFSTLDGVDAEFTYTPATHTVDPNGYIRISGVSAGPAITNSYLDIKVLDAAFVITGPANLRRGETGVYTIEVLVGSAWPNGTIALSDILSGNGLAGGTFVDTTAASGAGPAGTFDPLTNTYTFYDVASNPETYIRTFEYTLRNDEVVPPLFPSYLINMTGVMNTQDTTGWTAINIVANKILFKCTASYPNCTTGYVGELKDYSIGPNGAFVGSANVTGNIGGGTLGSNGIASWSSSVPFTMSYTPASPGRKVLTATVTSTVNNISMLGQSYDSNSPFSLNDYIYVMANSMSLEGYENLSHGQTGHYILTMNGPFVGDINLSDTLSGGSSAGGTFDNYGVCTFTLADYNPTSNTSACAFEYTPATVNSDTVVTISAAKASNYNHTLPNASIITNVYPALSITSISPNQGKIDGGTGITITGKGFLPYMYGELMSCYRNPDAVGCASVVLDVGGTPAVCTNVKVINSTTITCTTSAHDAGYVNAKVDNGLENHTLNNAFNYVDITLDLSQDEVEIEISPISGSAFGVDVSSPSVSTNSQYGYTLTIEMSTSEQRLYSTANNEYINPVNGTWSYPATLSTNTWGYAIGSMPAFSGNKFAAVPQNGISRQVIKVANVAVLNDTTEVTFGAKVDPILPAGRYSGIVMYTAVINEY